jgi:glycerol uptake facilitator-like aquaporin
VTAWRAFGAEAIVTFLLVLVIVAVGAGARGASSNAPLAIGAALAAAILISGPVSGAGVNPARAIGPKIVAGLYTDWWVYLTAPLVGLRLPRRSAAARS